MLSFTVKSWAESLPYMSSIYGWHLYLPPLTTMHHFCHLWLSSLPSASAVKYFQEWELSCHASSSLSCFHSRSLFHTCPVLQSESSYFTFTKLACGLEVEASWKIWMCLFENFGKWSVTIWEYTLACWYRDRKGLKEAHTGKKYKLTTKPNSTILHYLAVLQAMVSVHRLVCSKIMLTCLLTCQTDRCIPGKKTKIALSQALLKPYMHLLFETIDSTCSHALIRSSFWHITQTSAYKGWAKPGKGPFWYFIQVYSSQFDM